MVRVANPNKRLSVSVVVPAYNEEHVIGRCLEALLAQTEPLDEIIVVDNNSTDGTAKVLAQYAGLTVVTETRKGITYARTAGFNAATSSVIARIDADTVVSPTWAATLRTEFDAHPEFAAIAGGAGVAEISPSGRFWAQWYYRRFRKWHEKSIGVSPMMYGFNGALRRTAWEDIRSLTTLDDLRISEDVDVTISLLKSGHVIGYCDDLVVKARLFRSMKPGKMKQYYQTDGYTLAKHEFGNQRRWVTDPN
jgi:glycosyltransferase involved in cell wall biosynthesis